MNNFGNQPGINSGVTTNSTEELIAIYCRKLNIGYNAELNLTNTTTNFNA